MIHNHTAFGEGPCHKLHGVAGPSIHLRLVSGRYMHPTACSQTATCFLSCSGGNEAVAGFPTLHCVQPAGYFEQGLGLGVLPGYGC